MKQFTLPLLRGLYLPRRRDYLNPFELRGEAAKPMQQIYESISRLAVMGEDERRSIWIRFQSEYDGAEWGYMHITTYREYRYMYIGAKRTHFAVCKWRVEPEENATDSANDFFGYKQAYREFADKVLVLHHGHVEAFGTTEEVFANHQLLKTAHLKPPKASVLLHMLKRRGLDVDVKLNLEEACDEIIDAKMIRK